jgi:hypothetical protein
MISTRPPNLLAQFDALDDLDRISTPPHSPRVEEKPKPDTTDLTDFELVNFLVTHGFERDTARKISDDLSIELVRYLVYSTQEEIDRIEYLSPEEHTKLWDIVLEVWNGLTLTEKNAARDINHKVDNYELQGLTSLLKRLKTRV